MLLRVLKRLDQICFGSSISRAYTTSVQRGLQAAVERNLDHSFITYYRRKQKSELAELCDKYGSDKGSLETSGHPYRWAPHTYADFYSRLFASTRLEVRFVFECGLGTNQPDLPSSMGSNGKPGASLRVWREYFPNARIFGADIDRSILFQEEGISTGYMDQTDANSISDYWTNVGDPEFDFMLDDGLHTFDAGVCLFENSFPRVREGGVYVIEDVMMSDLEKFSRYFAIRDYNAEIISLFSPSRPIAKLHDNSLIVVRK